MSELLYNDYNKFYNKDKSNLTLDHCIELLDDYYEDNKKYIYTRIHNLYSLLSTFLLDDISENSELVLFIRINESVNELSILLSGVEECIEDFNIMDNEIKSSFDNIEYNILQLVYDYKAMELIRDNSRYSITKNLVL